ncbi:MAG TPA: hypothetical protein VMY37_20575 [Thermoguttaceae bacterium]|nr:hypothetical protein [Thermoguttaceae bacterium]
MTPPSPRDAHPPVDGVPSAAPVDDSDRPQPAGPVVHPLANLLSRLWAERAHGAVIELHLSDGQTIAPDRYALEMSRGSIGVFALSEPDGTYTVTAVAWDSVARVQVRRLRQLPDEFRP